MSYRKVPLVKGETYHIFTKSIAGFRVFNSQDDYKRMVDAMVFYSVEDVPCKFSDLADTQALWRTFHSNPEKIVRIIAYCVMPTHIHIVVRQSEEFGITRFMSLILKSYSKYFNVKHGRKGPLWEGRFKSVPVKTDEQLLHLTRYVHLNPVTGYLINKPDEWPFSSFEEYVSKRPELKRICSYNDTLSMGPETYRKFAEDHIAYQRELAKIKDIILE